MLELLTVIDRLENRGQIAEAAMLREKIPKTNVLGESAVDKLAVWLEERLFAVGGHGTINKVFYLALIQPPARSAGTSANLHNRHPLLHPRPPPTLPLSPPFLQPKPCCLLTKSPYVGTNRVDQEPPPQQGQRCRDTIVDAAR